jgi:hypothetical protein
MGCEHGEWYVGNGNMVCGRGCDRRASDIIAELTSRVTELEKERPTWFDLGPDRDILGRVVRDVWLEWSRRKTVAGINVKPHHLAPWEEMPEQDREVDRLIGETLFRAGVRYVVDSTSDDTGIFMAIEDIALRLFRELEAADARDLAKEVELGLTRRPDRLHDNRRGCLRDALSVAYEKGRGVRLEPDALCVTIPDGGCKGIGCMHDVKASGAE